MDGGGDGEGRRVQAVSHPYCQFASEAFTSFVVHRVEEGRGVSRHSGLGARGDGF